MKRTLSDSDTDEIFDDSIKGSPSQSCPVTARKKRRGIIEKRRRDRINNSLTELRRLVPAAYEKQGSAKLEKAEILQMTVDHLKYLHAKGIDGSFHPYGEAHAYAMDYRVLGFRECASEVARYMVTVEGMDIQDPLRLRLMSHLQCYMAQREFQSRQHYTHSHSQFSSHGQTGVALPHGQQHPAAGQTADPASSTGSHGTSLPSGVQISETATSGRQMIPMITSSSQEALSSCHARLPMPPSTGASVPINSSTQISSPVAPIQSLHTQYPGVTYNSLPVLSPNGFSPTSSSHMTHSTLMSKPYRPWGAEMVY